MREAGAQPHWDRLVERLHVQRQKSGSPSYGEIAERIRRTRIERGSSEFEARVARSSVYDAFKLGRTRINVPLTREIFEALGAEPGIVDVWLAGPSGDRKPDPPRGVLVIVVLVACVGLNFLGRIVVDGLSLPIYLDMVGTCLAAVALGPWRGALVGGMTNVIAIATSGWVSLPFMVVNIVGALIWGYGVQRYGLGRSLARFFGLCLLVAAACSALAVPILLVMFGGSVGQGQDFVTDSLREVGLPLWLGVTGSNLLTSAGDKMISGFVALVGISLMPRAFQFHVSCVAVGERMHPMS